MVNQTEEACFRLPGIIRVAMPDCVFTPKPTAIPRRVNRSNRNGSNGYTLGLPCDATHRMANR